MRMKTLLLTLVMVVSCAVCSAATVKDSQVYLGGITCEQTTSEVVKLKGVPSSTEDLTNKLPLFKGHAMLNNYSDLSAILANGRVLLAYTQNNTSVYKEAAKTVDGASVGMTEGEIKKIYGEPTKSKPSSTLFYSTDTNPNKGLLFILNKEGRVEYIGAGYFD